MLNTPILFLIFNRLDTVEKVFEKIKEARPTKLYIAGDGPRIYKEGEAEKVEAVRHYILNNIDWKCEIKTLFRNKNLGCGIAVSEAITWFFEHEKEGIILEDDCLPAIDFFWFCERMLHLYRDDDRIGCITGTNHLLGKYKNEQTFFYSALTGVWGWASWKRVWNNYTFNLPLNLEEVDSLLKKNFSNKKIRNWQRDMYLAQVNHKIDTWDIQFSLMLLSNQQLTILPSSNLISNIGHKGTHTENTLDKHVFFNMPIENIDLVTLINNQKISINPKFEIDRLKNIEKYGLVSESIFTFYSNKLKRYLLKIISFLR